MHDHLAALGIAAERTTVILTRLVCWVLTIGGTGYLIASHTGTAPHLVIPATWGETPINLGRIIASLPVFLGLLGLALVPSVSRVLQLEASHRSFQISIADVIAAYQAAHQADRSGIFTLSHEYDAVRERITYLRSHPDLLQLDGELLELAAQMSTAARDLAARYSDERVAHATSSLAARERELTELQRRIEHAQQTEAALRRHLSRVTLDEAVAVSQLEQHSEAITTLLAEAGLEWRPDGTVVPLHRPRGVSS